MISAASLFSEGAKITLDFAYSPGYPASIAVFGMPASRAVQGLTVTSQKAPDNANAAIVVFTDSI
ncbi:hypothetical protein AX768_06050 [Burkholderia sp. PAMC 28687]|nr:hypothetical protein AXG89_34010 [Burkholderia sp. PAMC 26561]AMM13731.1 hypothetical protein AX768_06050 [Burkholderia sp. PAMC 28687]